MSRKEFLNRLYQGLQGMEKREVDSIMFEYETHFDDGLQDGRSESEIASELGQPEQIAKELRANMIVERAYSEPNASNTLNAIFSVIGLSFLNFFVITVPFMIYISLMIGLGITAVTFMISPLLLLLDLGVNGMDAVPIFEVFMSVALVGAGILLMIGLYQLFIAMNRVIMSYIKWNIRTVKGGRA